MYYAGFLESLDTHDINSIHCVSQPVVSFDTYDISSFVYNFLNNGQIFNLIGLLELSQSPLASYGVICILHTCRECRNIWYKIH